MFISFRSFNHDMHSTDYLEAVNFYIVILKTGVLTVSIWRSDLRQIGGQMSGWREMEKVLMSLSVLFFF